MAPYALTQWAALLAPLALIPATRLAFRALSARHGATRGYLEAFGLYLLVFCAALPLGLLRPEGVLRAFRPASAPLGDRPLAALLLMGWPLLGPLPFKVAPSLRRLDLETLGLSLLMGLAVGFGEELLWRGTYLLLFDRALPAIVYPSFAFAVWHLAPLSMRPNSLPGGSTSFVLYAFALGLSYAGAAALCGSLLPVALAHALHDALGLPGLMFSQRHPAPLQARHG